MGKQVGGAGAVPKASAHPHRSASQGSVGLREDGGGGAVSTPRLLGGAGCREGRDWGSALSSSWAPGGIGQPLHPRLDAGQHLGREGRAGVEEGTRGRERSRYHGCCGEDQDCGGRPPT